MASDGNLQQEEYIMERLRKLLYNELKTYTPNVYYQPPSSKTLQYPCIVFSRENVDQTYANDKIYFLRQNWQIKCISTDSEWDVPKRLLESMQFIEFDRTYPADNLYHTILNLNTNY